MIRRHNFEVLLEKWARPFSSIALVLSAVLGVWYLSSDTTPDRIRADLIPIAGSCAFLGFAIGFVGMWLLDKELPSATTMLAVLFSSLLIAFAMMVAAVQNGSQTLPIVTYEALALLILFGTLVGGQLGDWLFDHPYM